MKKITKRKETAHQLSKKKKKKKKIDFLTVQGFLLPPHEQLAYDFFLSGTTVRRKKKSEKRNYETLSKSHLLKSELFAAAAAARLSLL